MFHHCTFRNPVGFDQNQQCHIQMNHPNNHQVVPLPVLGRMASRMSYQIEPHRMHQLFAGMKVVASGVLLRMEFQKH